MMSPSRIVGGLVVIVLIGLIGSTIVNRAYLDPRRELLAEREEYADQIRLCEKQAVERIGIDRELEAHVNRTLGSNRESVNSELRARLNMIGAELGIAPLRTNSRTASTQYSPAKWKFSRRAVRDLRDRPDFQEVEGTITGQGTLEQALRLVHRIDAEPWLKHIDTVQLDPKRNGEQFDITITLTTLYIPGGEPEPIAFTYDPSGFDRYVALIENNPFHKPDPKPVEPAPPITEQTSPPPAFPYDQWELRGVVRDGANSQVLLGQRGTQETRWLAVGESLHEAALVAVGLDEAEFKVGDRTFIVRIGRTLNDREPVRH